MKTGRPPTSPDGPNRHTSVWMTPFALRVCDSVIANEAEAGRPTNRSSVVRRLLLMGWKTYLRTKMLPGHER